jgi:methylenetetrahydrofolate reductase (NADPH)
MTEVPAEEEPSLTDSERLRLSWDSKPSEEGGPEIPFINVCKDVDFEKEMDYLKTKIEAGARFIVTQMFFDVEVYGTFVAACRARGIDVPVVPGIMLLANYGGFKRMIKFCKTRVPVEVMQRVEELKEDVEGLKAFGIDLAVRMCRRLLELGAPGLHFYTLNTSAVTIAVIEALGYHKAQ